MIPISGRVVFVVRLMSGNFRSVVDKHVTIHVECGELDRNMHDRYFRIRQITCLHLRALRLGLFLINLPLYAQFRMSDGLVIRLGHDIHTFSLFSPPAGSSSDEERRHRCEGSRTSTPRAQTRGSTAVIADADAREVDPSCVDVHKRLGGGTQRGSAAVIANADMREVDPSCVGRHK
jgi:hypothetical protein